MHVRAKTKVEGIIRDRIVSRHRSVEGYQKMSAALKVPKNTVASIILKWKTFGTTKTLLAAKLSKRGRRAFDREGTKNTMVTLTELQRSSVEMGEPPRRTTISCLEETWHHPYGEAWWWQHHAVGVLFNGRDWEISQDRCRDEQSTERSLMKICSRVLRTSDWGEGTLSNKTTTLSTQAKTTQEWIRDKSLNVLE